MAFGSASSVDVFTTRGLSKFVAALAGLKAPTVVDLGAAVGANVTFLGELFGCKLDVEDVLSAADIWWPPPLNGDDAEDSDAKGAEERATALEAARHLGHKSGSVDGVLCWDVFDYLQAEAAAALGREVTRVLRPGGVTFMCHGPRDREVQGPVQYEILDEMTLKYRTVNVARPALSVRESREMTRLFAGLSIGSSFLLKSRMRELVLRKPLEALQSG